MAEQSLKDKTVKGVIWSSVERFSVQGVQFLVMLFIARLLEPKDFGLVGMLAIFIAVAQTLIDSGFSQALIRKQNRTEADNSTVFYFNIIVSFVLYLLLYCLASWVANFYDEPLLCPLMRFLCLIVIINSFGLVQRTIFTANVDFKTQAKASFAGAVVSGAIGVAMAFMGYGVWTLVWQQLINTLVTTVLMWLYSNWHPKLIYSWKSFRELFIFGSKLLVSALLNTIYSNLYTLIIGKVFSAESLGQYTQADRFTKLPSSNLTEIIHRVTFPALCKVQDNEDKLKGDYIIVLRLSAYIIFPLMCLLAGLSYPLVDFLIGSKWKFSASLIIPICFSGMWYPIHGLNLNILQVMGRSDLFLKLEIIKKVVSTIVLVCTIPFGVLVMCYGLIVSSLINLYVNSYYTRQLIGLDYIAQLKELSGTLSSSLLMFGVVFISTFIVPYSFLQIVIGVLLGGLVFGGISYLFKFTEFRYLMSLIKK